MDKKILKILVLPILLMLPISAQQKEGSPEDNLPPNIKRITQFGERADWSHDGKKILYIEKTYGDAYEIELSTGIITLITGHFYHGGFTRALYLSNGDVLLSGCTSFDSANPQVNRQNNSELWVLDKSYSKPPVRLGTKCSEGPAVSRKHMKIAWTVMHRQYPDIIRQGQYLFYLADIIFENGTPKLSNRRVILDNLRTLGEDVGIETQNFIPPVENYITFTAQGEVMILNINTGEITNISNTDKQDDEPEGIFPDGKSTLIESDRHNLLGSAHMDLWKLKLDKSGEIQRLTYFSNYDGYRASNGVVSDDGRFLAFQMGRSSDLAGVGHGIFVLDLKSIEK